MSNLLISIFVLGCLVFASEGKTTVFWSFYVNYVTDFDIIIDSSPSNWSPISLPRYTRAAHSSLVEE